MNPLDQFEADQKLLNELKDMFEFTPPFRMRRAIEDLYFTHVTSEDGSLPNQKELTRDIYFLINFLNEVESLKRF